MPNWNSIFGGLGTEIVIFILDSIVSGFVGYKIGCHVSQKQKAGDYATQTQNLEANISTHKKNSQATAFSQTQEAEDNAKQIQCGRVQYGHK